MVAPVFSALFLTLRRRRLGARASTLKILAVLLDLSVFFSVVQEPTLLSHGFRIPG